MANNPDQTPPKPLAVIKPPNMLDKRVVVHGGGAIDLEAIERAEKALEALSENFDGWMVDELGRLGAAREAMRAKGRSEETMNALFHCAHDIKGQATTLGYPLAAEVAASLCRVIEQVRAPERVPQILIDQHVDAIAAIVREAGRSAKDATAKTLAERLRLVTLDYLKQEQARQARRGETPSAAA